MRRAAKVEGANRTVLYVVVHWVSGELVTPP